MFSWRFRLVGMALTLTCAGSAFFATYVVLDGAFVPSWPYFVSMIGAAIFTQIILISFMPRIVRRFPSL